VCKKRNFDIICTVGVQSHANILGRSFCDMPRGGQSAQEVENTKQMNNSFKICGYRSFTYFIFHLSRLLEGLFTYLAPPARFITRRMCLKLGLVLGFSSQQILINETMAGLKSTIAESCRTGLTGILSPFRILFRISTKQSHLLIEHKVVTCMITFTPIMASFLQFKTCFFY